MPLSTDRFLLHRRTSSTAILVVVVAILSLASGQMHRSSMAHAADNVFDPEQFCDELYASALEYKKNSRLADAREELIAVIEACPARTEAHLALGNVHLGLNDPAAAAGSFEAALELDSSNISTQEALAYAYTVVGELDRAEGLYLSILVSAPNRVAAMRNLAYNYTKQSKLPEAITLSSRVVELDPGLAIEQESERIQSCLGAKAFSEAIHVLHQRHERNPEDLDTARKHAYSRFKMKQWEAAVDAYGELLERETDAGQLEAEHKLRLYSAKKAGLLSLAYEDYEYFLVHGEDPIETACEYGGVALDAGDVARAEVQAHWALERDEDAVCAIYLLGEAEEAGGTAALEEQRFDEARSHFETAKSWFARCVDDDLFGASATKQLDRMDQHLDRVTKLQERHAAE